jgi:predicted AlkP superfamily phosphohydrolase/phosphomutase
MDRPAAHDPLPQLLRRLSEVRDPTTGARILGNIYRREELYSGPHVQNAPQLIFELTPGYMVDDKVSVGSTFDDVLPSAGTGWHHPDGFFAFLGPGIARSREELQANITDIAPTILHLLGEPVPRSMDGRVLEKVFESQVLADAPVRYSDTSHLLGDHQQDVFSDEDMEVIYHRLKDLGYLG